MEGVGITRNNNQRAVASDLGPKFTINSRFCFVATLSRRQHPGQTRNDPLAAIVAVVKNASLLPIRVPCEITILFTIQMNKGEFPEHIRFYYDGPVIYAVG